ncbi:hypothetical protein HYH03_014578 [Edaphochlamys debaryana]|uniref:phytol kinase n=1 Tax=Edaphochlamys debaryana TaxID=47281 RepID=A0A835XNH9_9CHLO|nr:hypothetical protein HYH03_014578 [Edaphochlamys debaryana]|eukprot:KAG2486779.1 hypothetical protein HYH03_014578 [Edaphochlamys debaryana]
MPPRAAAARNARARTPEERAVETLKSMANQALRLASGRDACAWSPTEVNAASEAIDTLGPRVLYAMGESRLAGLVIMLGLALRRATPSSPGITDGQRSAYAALHPKLTTALVNVIEEFSGDGLSGAAPLEVCTALIKSHALRAFCPLLAAAAAPLLPGPQPQQPSRRSVQSALALAGQVRSALGLMAETMLECCTPEQRQSLTATLATELAESGLLEHWARLVIGLGACEDGEDGAAKEAAQLGKHLVALAGHDSTDLRFVQQLDPWTELLLSGPCPCLAYLLSSHLVAFAAELDGGPTYGLPPAASEAQLARPSISSAQPPRPQPPVPLVDTAGFPLRPRKPLGTHLTAPALRLWTGVLKAAGQTLGMRLATSMAHSWTVDDTWKFLLLSADSSINKNPWDALLAAHDPAAWLDPAVPPLQGTAAVGRMDPSDIAFVAKLGLSLAREALEPARVLADMPGQAVPSDQLEKQLGAWWRAALAWAGLWGEMESGRTLPMLRWELVEELLEIRSRDMPGTPNSLDARLAMSSGYLPVLEAVLRHPDGRYLVEEHRLDPFACEHWGHTILHAGPRSVASFAATLSKLLGSERLLAAAKDNTGNRRRLFFPSGLIKLVYAGFKLFSPSSKTHLALAPGDTGDAAHVAVAGPSDGGAGPSHAPAAASGGGSSPPAAAPQLPLTAACVALHLLPGVAALARVLYGIQPDKVYDLESRSTFSDGLVSLMELLLVWVPPILLAAEPLGPTGPDTAVRSASSGASSGPAGPGPGVLGSAPESASTSTAQHAWGALLWDVLDLPFILGATATLMTRDPGALHARHTLTPLLADALWALMVRAPARFRSMVAAADSAEAAAAAAAAEAGGTSANAGAQPGPSQALLRRALAQQHGGADCTSLPELIATELSPEPFLDFAAAVKLHKLWPRAFLFATSTSLLAPVESVVAVLPLCSNPLCLSLGGPSEAAVQLFACSGCGEARYCSRRCQEGHWGRGHEQECGNGGGSGGAGALRGA